MQSCQSLLFALHADIHLPDTAAPIIESTKITAHFAVAQLVQRFVASVQL